MPTLTELKNGENPEFVEKLNNRVWGLLMMLQAEQNEVDITFTMDGEQYCTADPKSMKKCLGFKRDANDETA